jgi:nicotinate-nucleotide adenylyltransferase
VNIGIMGGTFDPIHNGHLIVAKHAQKQGGLDEVWFMPSSLPPHKETEGIVEAADRLEMVSIAIRDCAAFRLCELEINRGGTSYSIDSAKILIEQFPSYQFSWIIGADMIAYLPQWHRIDELMTMIRFIGVRRPGYEKDLAQLSQRYASAVQMVDAPMLEISSSNIRERLLAGASITHLVPESIESYIRKKGLYGS